MLISLLSFIITFINNGQKTYYRYTYSTHKGENGTKRHTHHIKHQYEYACRHMD